MQREEVDRLLMKPTARKRLGRYVLLGRLGHGGMGKIYLAFAPGPGGVEKLLVIKRLHSHLTGDAVLVSNFLDEARLSMVLSHPGIVHTYDVGEVDGRYFMVMEYIDGQNLGVLLRTAKRAGRYPSSALWSGLFLGALDALHAAHTAKDARGRPLEIIHRDVSPQNIIVTYDGVPKLVDFGIAKAALRINQTDAGVLKGKYAYMSPEQCESRPLDPRSDVFSAGVVLWEMLAGRRLYKSDSVVKSVERILREPPIAPGKVNPDCDPELGAVALKALAKDPDARFASAEEFRDALDDALHLQRHHVRQSEVRDLMEGLFGDLRERQQQVLEASLAGVADARDGDELGGAGQSDSSPDLEVGSESESDLQMLRLSHEGETTTPSAAQRSPLVTQDDEERGAVAVLPSDAHGDAPTASALPTQPAMAPWRSRAPLMTLVAAGVGVGVMLLAVGALALAYALGAFGPERGEAPTVIVKRGDAVPAAPLEPDPVPAPEPGRAPEPEPPPAPAPAPPTEPAPAPKAKKGPSKVRPPKRQPERTVPRETTAERAAPAPVPPATLTLATSPWVTVYLGTKRLGETPLVNVSIPAGEVELLLVNEGLGIRQPYLLKAESGRSYRKKLKLD